MAEDINTFLRAFEKVRRSSHKDSNQYVALCPAHDDNKQSLSIKYDPSKDKIALWCHAGCRTEDVLSAVGKDWSAIQPEKEVKAPPKWHYTYVDGKKYELTAEYPYRDSEGHYLCSKLRYENKELHKKDFRFGRLINNELEYGKGGAAPTLYNLPELVKAIKDRKTVYYVEGEKDVETLRKMGITAVSAGSVSDWKSDYAQYFIGAEEVVIIVDRDEPGKKLADHVSRDLRGIVYRHKVITPSGSNHGDVTDYLTEEGGTKESLFELVNDSSQIFARWVGDKGKINPDLLAAEYMKSNSLFLARNPGTKSDIIFLYRNGVYHKLSDTELAGEIRKWIPVGVARPDTISQVVKLIIYSAPELPYDALNADEQYINLRNGLMNIHTGELTKHKPDLISTLQLDCNYRPGATAPEWKKFVRSLCYDPEAEEPDEEMIRVLQEWTGFILSPIYGYRIKKSLLLYSALGNSGKSVFMNVIIGMLGNDAMANVDFESLGSSRWATGNAFGKRLLAIGDEGGESINSSKIFKQMTGGDPVEAEFKGMQHFTYKFIGVICAACNLLPFFNDDKGNHVSERLMLLNCRHTIPMDERDPLYTDKLLEEKDGIFIWAMEGLRRFLDNGMKFSPCNSADALMDEYRARHDTMYAFINDRIDVTGNRSDYILKSNFQDMYRNYCQELDRTPLSKDNIKQRLASIGIPEKFRDGYAAYIGIKEKPFTEILSDRYPAF